MRYFGGKTRIAKAVVQILQDLRKPGQIYLEPFLGGGSVFSLMDNPKIGSDVIPELIQMWQDIQGGWVPPREITKEMYNQAREGILTDGLRAFIGFGCSFGGKWFGGYANTKDGRNYALNAHNSCMAKAPGFQGAELLLKDFFTWNPTGYLIYCDPPYVGKTKPGMRSVFDTDMFWEHVRELSRKNVVVSSEVVAPSDFEVVWENVVKTDMQHKNQKQRERRERLFMWSGKNA